MPSLVHEILVELFRSRPDLAPQLVEQSLHVPLPTWSEATVGASDFSDVQPTEYRADLVIVLGHPTPVFGLVVEVQLRVDRDKPRRWVHYANTLAMRLGCPTAVLVVAPLERVARWAEQSRDLGPGFSFRPLVMRNRDVPALTDPARAAQEPELSVLSAMAHGRGDPEEATRVALAAVEAIAGLDRGDVALYIDFIQASLGQAARRAFEAHMSVMDRKGYVPLSDWAKEHFYKGVEEGKLEGLEEGKLEGRAEERAAAILAVLDARGLTVTDAERDQVRACRDLDVLDRWLRLAATALSASALWSPP